MVSRLVIGLLVLSFPVQAAPKKSKSPAKSERNAQPAGPLAVQLTIVDRVEALQEAALSRADVLARQRLANLKVRLLPEENAEQVLAEQVKSERARGFRIRLSIARAPNDGLSAEALVTTFPGLALRGSWNVSASGADIPELVEAIVPQVLDEAFVDLGWAPAELPVPPPLTPATTPAPAAPPSPLALAPGPAPSAPTEQPQPAAPVAPETH